VKPYKYFANFNLYLTSKKAQIKQGRLW